MVDLDNLDELIDEMKQGNAKYLLVNVVSRRVKAYSDNNRPLVEAGDNYDPATMALAELYNNKLKLVKENRDAAMEAEESVSGRHEEEE